MHASHKLNGHGLGEWKGGIRDGAAIQTVERLAEGGNQGKRARPRERAVGRTVKSRCRQQQQQGAGSAGAGHAAQRPFVCVAG